MYTICMRRFNEIVVVPRQHSVIQRLHVFMRYGNMIFVCYEKRRIKNNVFNDRRNIDTAFIAILSIFSRFLDPFFSHRGFTKLNKNNFCKTFCDRSTINKTNLILIFEKILLLYLNSFEKADV